MAPKKAILCSPLVRSTAQLLSIAATAVMVLHSLDISATAKITYTIDEGNRTQVLSTNAIETDRVLEQADVEFSQLDLVSTQVSGDDANVTVVHRHFVDVACDGMTTSLLAQSTDTVQDVLDHLNIKLAEFDQLSVPADTVLGDDITALSVIRSSVSYRTESTPVPFGSVRQADPDMPIGEEGVASEGVEGSIVKRYRTVSMEDGTVTEELLSTEEIAPVDEVISYGTKTRYSAPTNSLSTSSEYITNIDEEEGTFTTSKGTTYTYSGTRTLNATAYTEGPNGQTSTGRRPQVGVVAIDPKYISYGTQMFIMSPDGSFVYGKCVAGDCGGLIDDNDVDLYMTSESRCESWGRHNVTAFIITGVVDEG